MFEVTLETATSIKVQLNIINSFNLSSNIIAVLLIHVIIDFVVFDKKMERNITLRNNFNYVP